MTYPDETVDLYVDYTYDVLNRMKEVRENGATSGPGLLGVYSYDFLSRPTALAFGNGAGATLSYDDDSQDWSYGQDFASTGQDLTVAFTRNPSAQTITRTISNSAFSYDPPVVDEAYIRDGLNRYVSVGGVSFDYDDRQNLIDDGVREFEYDLENRLLNVDGADDLALSYDPLGRLRTSYDGTTTTTFLYAGDQLVSEYEGGSLDDRYAFGAGVDRPITWYEGSGLTTRNWLHADELGSVIATSNNSGVATIYSYGPYGGPDDTQGWSGLRFRYTGQIMLFEAQLYHYKARVYDPRLGRFLQTDPVGYQDDINLYAYVRNDPLNRTDPTGTEGAGCGLQGRACGGSNIRQNAATGAAAEAAANARMTSQTGAAPTNRVTFRAPGGETWVADQVQVSSEGHLTANEVKANGAQPVRGQPAGMRAVAAGTAVPAGPNAQAAGLTPGVPVGQQTTGSSVGLTRVQVAPNGTIGEITTTPIGPNAAGALSALSLAPMVTGVMSGRIRTDTMEHFFQDSTGGLYQPLFEDPPQQIY